MLIKVDMIVYMLDAKAMVTAASGTIAEFKVGIIGICLAADGTLVSVWFFIVIPPRFFSRFPKVDRFVRRGGARAQYAKNALQVVVA